TAPNRFEMFSTRIASASRPLPLPASLMAAPPTGRKPLAPATGTRDQNRCVACSSRPPQPTEVLEPLDLHVQEHRDENRESDDQVEVEGAHAECREADVQDAEDAHAEEAADDRARPAEERGTADHGGSDPEEHDVGATLERQDRRDPDGVHDPREAAEHAREHEVADLDPPDVDAALACTNEVPARRDGVQSPPRPDENDLEQDHHRDRPPEL